MIKNQPHEVTLSDPILQKEEQKKTRAIHPKTAVLWTKEEYVTKESPCLMFCDGLSNKFFYLIIIVFLTLGFMTTVFGHLYFKEIQNQEKSSKNAPSERSEPRDHQGVKKNKPPNT